MSGNCLRQWFCVVACLAPVAAAALTNNVALTPPMGWNDWNSYGCGITEGEVTNTAAVMVANGMKAAGYQFVNIDDCGLSGRDDYGVEVANASKFPHGIKWLADYTHSLGLKQGLYSDRGTNTCASYNSPGSYGHEYLDAMTYASWGGDYLKEDNCKVVPGSSALVDYGSMADGLMRSGRDIVLCICGNGGNTQSKGFVSWHPDVGNQWRTTSDIHNDFGNMLSKIDPNSTTAFLAGPGRWNDPDMLEVGNGQFATNFVAAQTHFTMWCIMAAPLIAGNNVTTMSAGTRQILTNIEAIAVDQDAAGEQGIRVEGTTSTGEVWSKPLGYDFTTRAVALLNRDTVNSETITCDFTNLGFQAGTTATVRDLWSHTDLGTFTNSFTATVVPYGSRLLKIVGAPNPVPSSGTNYLSDRQPIYAYTGSGTITKDKSIGGGTLTLAGTAYSKGVGVNSRSGLEYDLGGVCTRFQAKIGVDDDVGSSGSVVFQVFADGVKVYDSGAMTGSTATKTVDLDMTGVRRLTLGVNDNDNGTSSDHADWANALVLATNAPQMPHAPTGLTATAGNAITLNWNASLAGITYNVKRATSSSGPYTTLTNVPLTTFADANISSGPTYYYVVSAVSSLGESSNSVQVGAAQCFVPDAPTNIMKSSTGISNIVVKWNASPGATSYKVYRFTRNTAPVQIASGITATNFTDTPVSAASTNFYYVTASGSCSESGWTTFAGAVTPPPAPTGLTAIPSSGQVTLNWTAPVGGATFNVKRSTTSGGPYTTIAAGISSTGYADLAVANGMTYYYVVSALDIGGEGPNSSQAGATVSVPALVTAIWTNTITAAPQNWNANVNWTNVAAFPNGISAQAVIAANISAPQTIRLNQPITIGSLQIGDADNSAGYTVAANSGSLTFSDTNTIALTQLATSKGDVLATPIALATNVIIINNSTNPLTFAGDVSSIGGAMLTIGSGTLQVGDGNTNGSLGSVNVADNASLVFNRSDSAAMSGIISGSGDVTQDGSGNITLSGANSYTGTTYVNSGTLALNAVPSGTQVFYVASNATFQLNANYKTLTLAGNGTWNVNANNDSGAAVSYSTSENVSAFTGNTYVFFGTRYWLGAQQSMPAGTMYVTNGGQLGISYNGLLTGSLHIAGAAWGGTGGENDGALRLNSGNNSGGNFAGTVTLDDDAGVAAGQTGGVGTVSANISGAHTLTIVNGAITLSGINNFGALNIPNGVTAVAGSSMAFGGGSLTVNGTAQLNGFALSVSNVSGTGTVSGDATVKGILTPGMNSIGTLSFGNNLTLNGGSMTAMELNKSLSTNDVVQVTGTLTYGGALMLTNLSGTLANGDSFKLFNAGAYAGAFTNIVPTIPGINLAWNTNNLMSSGILSIVSSPTAPPKFKVMAVNENNFIFSGSNGVPNWPYYILASTNVSLPLVNWQIVSTNAFDANGNFLFTNPVNASAAQNFYLLKLQ